MAIQATPHSAAPFLGKGSFAPFLGRGSSAYCLSLSGTGQPTGPLPQVAALLPIVAHCSLRSSAEKECKWCNPNPNFCMKKHTNLLLVYLCGTPHGGDKPRIPGTEIVARHGRPCFKALVVIP